MARRTRRVRPIDSVVGVDADVLRRRIVEARVGRLATVTPAGTPRIVPCCFASDGDLVFTAVDDVKPKSSPDLARIKDVAANPSASLLVDHYADDWSQLWWIRLDGHARVADPSSAEAAHARRLLAAKYEQYARRPPPGPVLTLEVQRRVAWP
jgi:PPOX class probable F420-dependent enzyme